MIKIKLKKNLLFLLAMYISYFIRIIISIVIDNLFELNAPYLLLYMMSLGEIIGGSTIYIYQISYSKKKRKLFIFQLI